MKDIFRKDLYQTRLAFWRAVVCFAMIGFTFYQCKKDPIVGSEIQPVTDHNALEVAENFEVTAFTEFQGPLRSDENFSLLGAINDPVFGPAQAEFYLTIGLPDELTLSDTSFQDAVVDSVRLNIFIDEAYGNTGYPQAFKIHRLNERITREEEYTSDQTLSFDPEPLGNAVLEFGGITELGRQSIAISPDFGQEILDNAGTTFTNHTTFSEWFTGFYFALEGPSPTVEEKGAVYIVNPSIQSGFTIFYHTPEENGSLTFEINGTSPRYNLFEHNYTGTEAGKAFSGPEIGEDKIYLDGMAGTKATIHFQGLENFLAEKAVINRAVITFEPVTSYDYFEPSGQLFLVRLEEDGSIFLVEDLLVNSERYGGKLIDGKYEFDVTLHMQNIMASIETGSPVNTNFALFNELPAISGNVANRTVLKGSNNIDLKIYYTPLN